MLDPIELGKRGDVPVTTGTSTQEQRPSKTVDMRLTKMHQTVGFQKITSRCQTVSNELKRH